MAVYAVIQVIYGSYEIPRKSRCAAKRARYAGPTKTRTLAVARVVVTRPALKELPVADACSVKHAVVYIIVAIQAQVLVRVLHKQIGLSGRARGRRLGSAETRMRLVTVHALARLISSGLGLVIVKSACLSGYRAVYARELNAVNRSAAVFGERKRPARGTGVRHASGIGREIHERGRKKQRNRQYALLSAIPVRRREISRSCGRS